jgi:hypothetical protein
MEVNRDANTSDNLNAAANVIVGTFQIMHVVRLQVMYRLATEMQWAAVYYPLFL